MNSIKNELVNVSDDESVERDLEYGGIQRLMNLIDIIEKRVSIVTSISSFLSFFFFFVINMSEDDQKES